MDWINQEVDRIKNDNAAKQQALQNQETINAHAWQTWERFRSLTEEAVTRLNASPEMRQRIGAVEFNGHNVQILPDPKSSISVGVHNNYPRRRRPARKS